MKIEIKVPDLPESVSDALVLSWYKKAGDAVKMDDVLLELETDKVVLEVPAPESGVLSEIRVEEGETVSEGVVLAILDTEAKSKGSTPQSGFEKKSEVEKNLPEQKVKTAKMVKPQADDKTLPSMSPSVRRLIEEHQLDPAQIEGTGKHGRIVKDDVLAFIEKQNQRKLDEIRQSSRFEPARDSTSHQPVKPSPKTNEMETVRDLSGREQKRVPMTRLRARIAERLLSVSQTTAMLTTFNEVNLSKVIQLRKDYQEMFVQTFDIKLGFMSLFVKATCEALKRFPDVNASIDGDEIVYHGFCDIGVAVSTDRGLVVPILRDAEHMSLSEIEKSIKTLADKARNNHLTMDDIKGGTFTITNGGVFGSMLSTPILNPPQSAILGMHAIKERPVAEKGQVVIRPMMYLALSYDHRIIDGKSAVQFLKTIKDLLEDPARILLDV